MCRCSPGSPCEVRSSPTRPTVGSMPRAANVIVYPTSYGAQHYDTEWLIRPGRALDPERFFIVINEREVAHMRHAELRPIPSIWGHRAGNPAITSR
jgi:hypothetical protein